MQPQQPQYPPPPPPVQPGTDPYQFIVNPGKPPRKSLLGSSNSMVKRILLVVGGIFLLLIIFVGLKNIIGGSGPINKSSLLTVVADQAELVHLSTGGAQDAVSATTMNFAITTQFSVTSEQSQLESYLKSHDVKATQAQLALRHSATIDTELNNAQSDSTFDATFTTVMQDGLKTYQTDLKQAYTLNKGPKVQALLNADYSGATLLAKQLTSPTS